jgi:hypothetical protein
MQAGSFKKILLMNLTLTCSPYQHLQGACAASDYTSHISNITTSCVEAEDSITYCTKKFVNYLD